MITDQERRYEEQRLQRIVTDLQHRLQGMESEMLEQKEGIKYLRRSFWSDISVNDDNWDDLLESYIDISQKSQTIADQERSYLHVHRMYERLRKMVDSPYFGRFDFQEADASKVEEVYIGISTLLDSDNKRFLVYDWRAPISSLYYDFPLGKAQYDTPMGEITGEICEKRQYVIKGGKLHYLFDTGEHIGDEILQQVLGKTADTQMGNIVATIQREQNQIIREANKKMVIVLGVAGSGKTSVAMQRIAYLLYRFRKRVTYENMLLLSPNPLFKQYIANVLPELGESNIEQSTLHEYIESYMGSRYQLEHPYTHLENRLLADASFEQEVTEASYQFKGSLTFYHILERYSKYLENHGFRFRALRFREHILISAREMEKQFYSYEPSIRLSNRIEPFVDWLLQRLKTIEKNEMQQDWVLEEIEMMTTEQYQRAYFVSQKRSQSQGNHRAYDDEETELRKMVIQKHFKKLRAWIKQLYFIDHIGMYKQLFQQPQLLVELADEAALPDQLQEICTDTLVRLKEKQIPYADSTPIFFLKECIEGFRSYLQILYLLVDEAQDYTPFQFKLLTRLFPRAKWTILGDPNQAIWGSGIDLSTDIPLIAQQDPENVQLYHMQRSYRSTKEIVAFSKAILPITREIIPFERSGEAPKMIFVSDMEGLHQSLITQAQNLLQQGLKTIAIICKTEAEAREAYQALRSQLDLQLITKDVQKYEQGILVIPSYLAKGLEFDAVLLYNASCEQYGRESERLLLYTAATRAMHHLTVYVVGEASPFLPTTVHPS